MREGLLSGYSRIEANAFFCSVFLTIYRQSKTDSSGDWSGGEIPGPMPNPEVKPTSADGTGGTRRWESRSLPGGNLFLFSRKIAAALLPTAIFLFLLQQNLPMTVAIAILDFFLEFDLANYKSGKQILNVR